MNNLDKVDVFTYHTDADLAKKLRELNRAGTTSRGACRIPCEAGWWYRHSITTGEPVWYWAEYAFYECGHEQLGLVVMGVGSTVGITPVSMFLNDSGCDWYGPYVKREPTKLELRLSGDHLYLPVPDRFCEVRGTTMLLVYLDAGDVVAPTENGQHLITALYAEANTNEFVLSGDTVWLDGVEIGHFDLPHYVPHGEPYVIAG